MIDEPAIRPWAEPRMLIGGALADARSGEVYDNVNPATGAVIGSTADGGHDDMDAAIGAARRAFDDTTWADDHAFRVRCIRQLHEAMIKHADDLRASCVAEVGAPLSLTYGAQLDTPVASIAWVADLLERYEWETDLGVAEPFGMPSRRVIRREPAGVVGAITPWNFPHQINLAKVVPALAAGNTVVLKPAPDTPWCATLLGHLVAAETDIPDGVLNVVTSSTNDVGRQLVGDPRVDLVSFTGSTATGRDIMRTAAEHVTKVFLELGGKSASIALDDADLATAAAMTAFQVMTHAGQGCAITSRFLVPRSRYDEAVDAVIGVMSALTYGDPADASHLMGPLISERQRTRVLGYVQRAVADGATVAMGGGIPSGLDARLTGGFFVEPTVLTGVQPDHTVAQEEVFGPVLAVLAHDGDDDAVRIANDSIYGLSGAVFAANDERALAVANRIRTGTIGVNGGLFYSADVPFGGFKQSGIGREMGVMGFEEYLETKSIAIGVTR
jgi:aldehyde dehydrogenase (NAD+)